MKAFSLDLRQRIVDAYDAKEGTREGIARRFGVSLGLVKKLLRQRRATGSISPRPRPGRPPAFRGENLDTLDWFVQEHPDATLEAIRVHFVGTVDCSIVAIHNALKRLGYHFKKSRYERVNKTGQT